MMNQHFESLPCTLTDDEWELKAQEAAQLVADLEQQRSEAKEAKKRLKAQEDELAEKVIAISREVRERREYRSIECYEQNEVERKTVVTIRTDTGEVVHSRGMSEMEVRDCLQLKLLPVGEDCDDGNGCVEPIGMASGEEG